MDCRTASNLISAGLDEPLTATEQAELAEHLSTCAKCSQEAEFYRQISSALREMGREKIAAPAELSGLIMAELRAETKQPAKAKPLWLKNTWQKALAAAAAVLIIIGGSTGLGLSNGFKMMVMEKLGGSNPPSVFVADNNSNGEQESPLANPERTIITQEDGSFPTTNDDGPNTEPTPTQPLTEGEENGNEPVTENTPASDAATANNDRANPNPTGEVPGRALLNNQQIVMHSTSLKINAADLNVAKDRAFALASEAGAKTEILSNQSAENNVIILNLTVESNKSSDLLARLAELGTVTEHTDDSNDVTSSYNNIKVQYEDLKNRPDLSANEQWQAQAASYKQQLDSWDAKVGKRVINLWLEKQ